MKVGTRFSLQIEINYWLAQMDFSHTVIGLIQTDNRKALRKAVVSFVESIKADKMYNSIPSVSNQKGWYVHPRADHPEIRAKFLKC